MERGSRRANFSSHDDSVVQVFAIGNSKTEKLMNNVTVGSVAKPNEFSSFTFQITTGSVVSILPYDLY